MDLRYLYELENHILIYFYAFFSPEGNTCLNRSTNSRIARLRKVAWEKLRRFNPGW